MAVVAVAASIVENNTTQGTSKAGVSSGIHMPPTADGVYEGTRPTCVADADEVEKNVCDPNTAANGSVDFTFYFIQNFRCN